MIDNIKFYINDKDRFEYNLEKHQKIPMNAKYDVYTGDPLNYPKSGKLKNLNVRVTQDKAYILGSLHKFNNMWMYNEPHNYNDFNSCEIDGVVDFICDSLVIDPNETKITNLEFGFNVLVDEDIIDILDRTIMYNFENHSRKETFRGQGYFKEFCKSDYSIKIYNKSKQYKVKQNILRVELKITRSRLLNKLGIHCLSDLHRTTYKTLFKAFLERFDKLLIVDTLRLVNEKHRTDKDLLKDGTNPNFWVDIKNRETRNVNAHRKEKFKRLLNDNYSSVTQNKIRNSLIAKFYELIDDNCSDTLQQVA
tara:strand:- start:82 stop:1002 length:921 start_codon:yes stop_codon:yes gene_type:complete